MKSRIFYTKPSITDLEVSYATDAAANGWGDQCYAYIDRFEALFKKTPRRELRDRNLQLHWRTTYGYGGIRYWSWR